MCYREANFRRDKRHVSAVFWRLRTVLRRDWLTWLKIFLFPIFISTLIIISCLIYSPQDLQLNATDWAYVTSTTPNKTENFFIDPQSGFQGELAFRNCTLNQFFKVGLVKTGGRGDALLDSIFSEINGAFTTYTTSDFSLVPQDFHSRDEVKSYVRDVDYKSHGLCFTIGWQTFDPKTNTFTIDIGFNYGDFYETRLPQTYY